MPWTNILFNGGYKVMIITFVPDRLIALISALDTATLAISVLTNAKLYKVVWPLDSEHVREFLPSSNETLCGATDSGNPSHAFV